MDFRKVSKLTCKTSNIYTIYTIHIKTLKHFRILTFLGWQGLRYPPQYPDDNAFLLLLE